MRKKLAALVGMSALVGAAFAAAGPVSAAPAPATAPAARAAADAADPVVVATMAHDLGLTPAAAKRRLAQETAATGVEPKARKAAGSSYGGSWFDPATGKLVVAVTRADAAPAVRRTGAAATLVTHSAKVLDAAKAAIDAGAKAHRAPAGVSDWRVDPRTNSVVVDVRADAAADPAVVSFVAGAQRRAAAGVVTVERTSASPTTLSAGTVGGDPYYSHGIRCSIGFSVYGGFVSAGHCAQVGAAVYGWDNSYVGNFQAGTFPGNDYSWVNVGSGWWTVPVVLGWGTVSDVLVHGSAEAPVGSSVCRSGSTTHWHCGTILGKNETVNYSQGSVYGLTETNVCAEPGDSGGSFITGDQAQGVTSGGYGDCTSGGETWFQPVNPILSRYGLTLQTA